MKIEDPKSAQEYDEFFFKRNQMDDLLDGKFDNDYPDIQNLVKIYPGSPKGPLPKDDPDFYSQWFMRNQPDDHIYGDVKNYHDIGVRYKYLWHKAAVDENAMSIEVKDDVSNHIEQDEVYPMQHYDG